MYNLNSMIEQQADKVADKIASAERSAFEEREQDLKDALHTFIYATNNGAEMERRKAIKKNILWTMDMLDDSV